MAKNAELSTIVYNNVDNLFRYTHVIPRLCTFMSTIVENYTRV